MSVSRDFKPYFHFRCVARATFDRNLIHSADACFLVMACVAYSRAQLKTLLSLLKAGKLFIHSCCLYCGPIRSDHKKNNVLPYSLGEGLRDEACERVMKGGSHFPVNCFF